MSMRGVKLPKCLLVSWGNSLYALVWWGTDLRCAAACHCRHHALSKAGGESYTAGEGEGANKCELSGDRSLPHSLDSADAVFFLSVVDFLSTFGDWCTVLQVMNALAMDFEDDTFDLVWACESGEHMPDKKKYVEEMARVLKPGELSKPP